MRLRARAPALVFGSGIVVMMLQLSCDGWRSHSTNPDHHHGVPEADEKIFVVTLWESGFEIFYEYALPVVDETVNFAIHVSDLETGRPRTDGSIVLRSASGQDAPFPLASPRPRSPGLYTVAVAFPRAGEWGLKLEIASQSGGATTEIRLPPITVAVDAKAAAAVEVPPASEGILFLKESQWTFETRTALAVKRSLGRRLRVPALVRSAVGRSARVTPSVAGRVLSPEGGTLPRPGQRVKRGEVVARVEPPLSGADFLGAILHHHELQVMEADLEVKLATARADEVSSEKALAVARSAFERVRRLAAVNAKSRRELDESEALAASSLARLEAAKRTHRVYAEALRDLHEHPAHDRNLLERFPSVEVHAPIDGVVDRLAAVEGESVEASRLLLSVVDSSVVHVVARVPEYAIAALSKELEARMEVPGSGARRRDEDAAPALTLVHRGLELDDDRTVPVTFEADNDDGRLVLGMSATVIVRDGPRRECTAVPETALVDENGTEVVFVQVSGETFERRPVVTGKRDGGWVEIAKGVGEGERIVTRGAYLVRLASLGSRAPAEHHH